MIESSRQRGIALVAVLWALVLLALIAATVLSESRSTSRLARNLADAAAAEALAEGGVHRAMAALAVPVASGGWRADGTVYAWRQLGGEIRVRIEDEGGKIDLNRGSADLLRRLLEGAGVDTARAETLADAIQDYRDADDRKRERGAEDPDYRSAGLPHEAKDAPFDAVEELQQVLGITREVYAAIAGAVTVHSRSRRPDLKAAPPAVRAALGGSEVPATIPTEDEGVTEGVGTAGPPVTILKLGPSAHRSRVWTYTIHSEARTESGALFARRAVVRIFARGTVPFRILTWSRGESSLFPALKP